MCVNKLPDPTFDYKLLAFPHETDRFIKYTPTSIEAQHKFEIHADVDLGINLDFVDIAEWERTNKRFTDPLTYNKMSDAKKHKPKTDDVKPLNTNKIPPREANILFNIKTTEEAMVPWLKKPEYFTSTKPSQNLDSILGEVFKGETKQHDMLTNKFEDDPEKAMDEIEQTFEDVASGAYIKNPHDKEATILEEWDVLPDENLWANEYIFLQHDTSQKGSLQENSLIKIFGVGHNANIAAYLIPKHGEPLESNVPQEYLWRKHYTVKAEDSKADKLHSSDSFFFVFDPSTLHHSKTDARIKKGIATYNNVSLTVRLQKLTTMDEDFEIPSTIQVTRIDEISEATREKRLERLEQIK